MGPETRTGTLDRDCQRLEAARRVLIACELLIALGSLVGCRVGAAQPSVQAEALTPAYASPAVPPATIAVSTPRWSYEELPSPTPSPLPTATATATVTPTPEPVTYVVQEGDNLSRIAASFGLTVVEIMAANSLGDPNSIRVGERLVIPGVVATPAFSNGDESATDSATPETAAATAAVHPTDTPQPTDVPCLTPTERPTYTPYPTNTPWPTYTPYPTYTPWPTYTPGPASSQGRPTCPTSACPAQTHYVAPTYTPYPTYTPLPSATPTHTPTPTPRPTATIYPTYTPPPTYTPYPTFTPAVPIKGPKPPGA